MMTHVSRRSRDTTSWIRGHVLRDADSAMYASKNRGRNRCPIFTAQLRDRELPLRDRSQRSLST
jgi:hypothetical protein